MFFKKFLAQVPLEKVWCQDPMGDTADGKKFGYTLNYRKNDGL
jgi:hypothetical protein